MPGADIPREQVMAWRIARHGLHRDTSTLTALRVLDLGVQEALAGSHRVALAARLPTGATLHDPGLALVWAQRGAPHLLRRAELPTHAARLYPHNDADAAARLGTPFTRSLRAAHIAPLAAFARAAAALRHVVREEIPRAQASTEMTAALPPAYSADCAPCACRHVFGSVFQAAGIAAGVEVLSGRPARLAPLPNRHDLPETAAGDLVADYLAVHGPATPGDLAGYLDTTHTVVKKTMWPAHLVTVRVHGRDTFLPEPDIAELLDAPDATEIVRLLPPMDPLLQGRDRELLVPDPQRRKQVWRIIGNPGAVLAGAEIAGMWRPKVSGKRLDITVTMFDTTPARVRTAVETEADTVAAARGLESARVRFDQPT
ncbi:DNA glycosylase AlkZ-like family protein [Actinokineospora guangxiensis]|uniref:DNA glycosylase AlkZ-like family protein n=1 Tax=Actinokineospora guangxiensis TaxID=1490288 RepID=A0ABW0EPY4_9PSEU